jgi:hypothetical protein
MSEEEIRRTEVRDRSGKGVSKTPISTKKLGVMFYSSHPSYTGDINGRIPVRPSQPGKKMRPYLKND